MYDIAIIGGGINGCGIARDAAGRGWSVLLAEKGDLAGATSSASSKLIHGGLRYLEQFRFRLVRDSLEEREVLLHIAPHLVRPLRFVLPHHKGLRPAPLIRLGLMLYDRLGGPQSLPLSASIDLSAAREGQPLRPELRRGFAYSDCRVDDARLVVLNAVDAGARGARICPRTEVVAAQRRAGRWHVELRNAVTGKRETITARTVVNASGAWVAVTAQRMAQGAIPRVRLVKGSHIVVRKLFDHDSAYIFQNPDRRVVFAIPYQRDFTLIGTTDVDFSGDPSQVAIKDSETAYLCAAANAYFARPIAPSDVVWSYSGVRALHDDGRGSAQDATRDFALVVDGAAGAPPLLSVVGGKITTYRHVAEEALRRLASALPGAGPAWTRTAPLPGGDFGGRSADEVADDLVAACPPLGLATAERLVAGYGTTARAIFAGVSRPEQLGLHFGAGLYQREAEHLVDNEWAVTADDILWRRTKLGLRFGAGERARLAEWLAQRTPGQAASVPGPGAKTL
jgi:glycerol-3-phosphate dehydrogenase